MHPHQLVVCSARETYEVLFYESVHVTRLMVNYVGFQYSMMAGVCVLCIRQCQGIGAAVVVQCCSIAIQLDFLPRSAQFVTANIPHTGLVTVCACVLAYDLPASATVVFNSSGRCEWEALSLSRMTRQTVMEG